MRSDTRACNVLDMTNHLHMDAIETLAGEVSASLPRDATATEFSAAALSAAIVDWVTVELFDQGRTVDAAAVLAAHDRMFAACWPVLVEHIARNRPNIGRKVLASLPPAVG